MTRRKRILVGVALFATMGLAVVAVPALWPLNLAFGPELLPAGAETPWGTPVDGLACRLVIEPSFVVGQPIAAAVEVKNVSDGNRYFVPWLDPMRVEYLTMEISGPRGRLQQGGYAKGYTLHENSFQPIAPGEVQRFEVADLRTHFRDLDAWWCWPERHANDVATGKYVVRFRFTSPKVPDEFGSVVEIVNGQPLAKTRTPSADLVANQWTGTITSAPVAFQVRPLANDDLVVHEWGVFTVFGDSKYANVNRKEEWGSLPSFCYRQFPKERLRWVPAAWDKPIIYFYARPGALRINVKVTFAAGAPVVWWPAVADPVDDGGFRTTKDPKTPRPFRALMWEAWLGERVPTGFGTPRNPHDDKGGWTRVEDFPLPKESWLRDARLPDARPLTVIGNIEGAPARVFPGVKDRPETERFLYYDGLVPAPDYLRCEAVGAAAIALRNRAGFDIAPVFVVDHRDKATIRFASVASALKPGELRRVSLEPLAAQDWPGFASKQVRQALVAAGLFEAEAAAVLKIWTRRLLEADGVTVFHLLAAAEYDRVLPLSVLPAPAQKPVRVGIALHPHMEAQPGLAARVARLMRDLDEVDFDRRDAANRELLEIGPLAIAMLRAELQKAPPLETARRIEAVLDRVDAAVWLKGK
jgi:hypothetical protein